MAGIQTSIDMVDNISATLSQITGAMSLMTSTFQEVQGVASGPIDSVAFDGVRESILSASLAAAQFQENLDKLRQSENAPLPEPPQPQWQTPQIAPVFDGGGAERYRQEIGATTALLERMTHTQQEIASRAGAMDILPDGAAADITAMNARISALRTKIEQGFESRVELVGVERANAETEQLRSKLTQAVQVQEQMNRAMEGMDVAAANTAYARLSALVNDTERGVRDNALSQQQFNNEIQNGATSMDLMKNKVLGMAAAYLSIRGVGQILNLSDTMTQNDARLNLMVDDGGSLKELRQKVFQVAQDSRAPFNEVSATVARLGLNARDAFSNNDEILAFAGQMNKQFAIGGASVQEQAAAMHQVTQAMASGRLQGDEFRSVMENAPLLAQSIADYMGMTVGELRDASKEGIITADVMKNALASSAEETNARFEEIPKTFGQVATEIKNNALMAFQPVLARLNELANSPAFQVFVANATAVFAAVAQAVVWVFEKVVAAGAFIAEHWSTIAPIISMVAVVVGVLAVAVGIYTAAQWLMNTALFACPIFWVIGGIILLVGIVYAAVKAWNHFSGATVSGTGIILGAIFALGSHFYNTLVQMWNFTAAFVNFFANVFTNPVASVKILFLDLALSIVGYLRNAIGSIEAMINAIPFINISITSGIDGFLSNLEGMKADIKAESGYKTVMDTKDYATTQEAFAKGNELGTKLENKIKGGFGGGASSFDYGAGAMGSVAPFDGAGGIAGDTRDIANNTNAIKSASEEDLKYLRDIAEREVVNRFTVAEINFEMGGVHNNVSSNVDLDGIAEYIGDTMMERLEIVAEGVYA